MKMFQLAGVILYIHCVKGCGLCKRKNQKKIFMLKRSMEKEEKEKKRALVQKVEIKRRVAQMKLEFQPKKSHTHARLDLIV